MSRASYLLAARWDDYRLRGRRWLTWLTHLEYEAARRRSPTRENRGWYCGTLERERVDGRGTYSVPVTYHIRHERDDDGVVERVSDVQYQTRRGTWRYISVDSDEAAALLAGE